MSSLNKCIASDISMEDLMSSLKTSIKEILCAATSLIEADPAEHFFYKIPEYYKQYKYSDIYPDNQSYRTNKSWNEYSMEKQVDSVTSARQLQLLTERHISPEVLFSTIEQFNVKDIVTQVRDFVDLWQLTPLTKFQTVLSEQYRVLIGKGLRYYATVYFSKPVISCPNPLSTARVYFHVNVPYLMPKHYPIMVCYRFEGFKTEYYALGRRQCNSWDFQRFYIDTILRTKLLFYRRILDCRFQGRGEEKEASMAVSEWNSRSSTSGEANKSDAKPNQTNSIRVFWERPELV